jgi:hypothetical protein
MAKARRAHCAGVVYVAGVAAVSGEQRPDKSGGSG